MANLLDLANKVKNFIQQNPTPVGFALKPVQQAIQNFGQNQPRATYFLNTKVEPQVQRLSSFMQQPYKPVQLPQANIQRPNIGQQIAQGGYNNLVKPLAEGLINAPANYVGGTVKTGLNLGNISKGQNVGARKILGDVGQVGKSILDVGTLGFGAGLAKTVAQQAGKQTAKQAIAHGAIEGGKFGGAYGLLGSLADKRDEEDVKKYLMDVVGQTGTGAVVGGFLGGATAAGSQVVGKMVGVIRRYFPNDSEKEIAKKIGRFARDEGGRFAKQQYMPKNEPKFYGDLRESIGLSKTGDNIPSIGMTTRPLRGSVMEAEAAKKGTQQLQMPKTQVQLSPTPLKTLKGVPQDLNQVAKGTVSYSSPSIVSQKGKLNVNRLNVGDEGKAALQAQEATVKPTVIGNKSVIDAARTANGSKNPISDDQMKSLMAQQLKNRQQVVDLTKQFESAKAGGASEQELAKIMLNIADQSQTARQGGTFAGRILQAQNIIADESASPMQKIFALLDNAGVDKSKYIKDAVRVDFDNPSEVVSFYRKFVHPSFGEQLDEYRYSNMLSSPLTHITNVASNTIQTGVIAPIEKTISGMLDFGKTAITGKERQYYASAGLQYSAGYAKALPQAIKKAWGVLSGKNITIRPDFEYIPTGSTGIKKAFTTPLRALEAMDQFFKTLVEGGVTKELQAGPRKLSNIQITDMAGKEATYRLFRQSFDPDGKLGQGGVLKLWDKWNSGIQSLRRLPGGKWVLPFLQTPTNILKQGVEYSPLGLTTIPGSKAPIEQLSKAIIGTGVLMSAYQLGKSGLLSWEVPNGEKARDLYYAAGLQPYSVKMGDKWVSFSKLGPLAYPFAMAAAFADADQKNPDEGTVEKIGKAMGGMMKFFGDQSYVRSIGDLVEAIQGGGNMGKAAFTSEAANLAGQTIPYKSFLTWVGRMIDPVYRKATTFTEKMSRDIPGLGQNLEPYTDPNGNPSKRDFPLLNAISPYKVSQEKNGNDQVNAGETTTRESDEFPFPDYKRSTPGQVLRADLNLVNKTNKPTSNQIVFHMKSPSGKVMVVEQTTETLQPGQKQPYGLEAKIPQDAETGTWTVWATVNGKEVAGTRKPHQVVQGQVLDRYDQKVRSTYTNDPTLERESIQKQNSPLSLYRQYEQKRTQTAQVNAAKKTVEGLKGEQMVGENYVYWDESSGTVKTIDLAFQPTPPKRTGMEALDKKSISKFNSEVTKKANNIYDLYEAGKLTAEEAEKQLDDLAALKLASGGGPKAKKPPKISAKKIPVPKGIKMTTPKKQTIQNIKIKKPPKPKAKKSKAKSMKVAPIKIAKLKGLTQGIRLA